MFFAMEERLSVESDDGGRTAGASFFDAHCVTDCAHMDVAHCCKLELVIWGVTYPNRLWCIWELFTLVAFMSLDLQS